MGEVVEHLKTKRNERNVTVTTSPGETRTLFSADIPKNRQEATNLYKTYKHHFIANLVLKLVIDDDVKDFELSSKNENSSIYDVVVSIIFKNRKETFVIQLEQTEKKFNAAEDFNIEERNASLKSEMKSLTESNNHMVLFTNCKVATGMAIPWYDKPKKCQPNKFIGISNLRGHCYIFKANQCDQDRHHDNIFQNFYVYTDQLDVNQLENCTFETFQTFSNDKSTFNKYINYVTRWNTKLAKKITLTKDLMRHVLAHCVFTGFIKPLSFVTDTSVNVKERTFREALAKFDLTVIDKKNFNLIESAWIDVNCDEEEERNIRCKYQLIKEEIEKNKNSEERNYSNEVTVSKVRWLLGECPLVVEGSAQVYQTIKICHVRNLVVLDDIENFNRHIGDVKKRTPKCMQKKLFRRLSDLKEDEHLYETFMRNFTYSLEGQKETELKYLIEVCKDIDSFITTDNIAEMLKAPLIIGHEKEILPPCYIPRKVAKNAIDIEFLTLMGANCVALVTCVTDTKSFTDSAVTEIDDLDKMQDLDHKIYIFKSDVSREQFSALCKSNPKLEFHHFRYLRGRFLEWIGSKNCRTKNRYFKKLNRYRVQRTSSDYVLHESDFFNEEEDISIICVDPGMGKSTLMKSLKNSSSSSKWTIVIYARRHILHFLENGADEKKFVKYILKEKCVDEMIRRIFKAMIKSNHIQIIWDGLDEVSGEIREVFLRLVKTFAEKGVKQWLTSRNNLKSALENTLSLFSRNITEFDENEQRDYVKNHLKIADEEALEIVTKIKGNVAFSVHGIFGTPLKIYMLTELFLKEKEKYLHQFHSMFTLLDLYEYFVNEKFAVLEEEDFKEENKHLKRIAANLYFGSKMSSHSKKNHTFLNKAKNGDIRFISHVTADNNVEFSHSSYGEYFAALYLYENEPSKARDRRFLSCDRYDNIRFFLDLMLTKKCNHFLAVIYKNPILLEQSLDTDLEKEDVIGRNILEVACVWNKNYPVVTRNLLLNGDSFKISWILNTEHVPQALDYRRINKKFNKFKSPVPPGLKKLMLFMPFLIPFYDSQDYLPALLYCAIRSDFLGIFDCIEEYSALKKTYNDISSRSILCLALYHKSRRILQKLFSEQRDHFEWECIEDLSLSNSEIDEIFKFVLELQEFRTEIPNSRGQLLTHYACEKNLLGTLQSLISLNAELHVLDKDGKSPFYTACKNGHLEILKLLVKDFGKINLPDVEGRLPIHHACEIGDPDTVKLLVANGAKVDVPDENNCLPVHDVCKTKSVDTVRSITMDGESKQIQNSCDKNVSYLVKFLIDNGSKVDVPQRNGLLPIHYACQNGYLETTKTLITNGSDVNASDENGRLPIHYACEKGHLVIVELLQENGAKSNIPDGDGRLPMHDVCERGYVNIMKFLVENGAEVNIPDGKGRLPIHLACHKGHLDIVRVLVEMGAKLDVPGENGSLPMHYACEGHPDIVTFLVENGAKVDVPNGDGRLPIHYACQQGFLSSVSVLVENGAKIDQPDNEGALPIHYACENGAPNMVDFLLKNGGKIDVLDANGRLPIHYACKCQSSDILELLKKMGALMDVPDRDGRSPIHYASRNKSLSPLKSLIKFGVKLDVMDKEGRLPIHSACEKGYLLTTDLLVEKGAQVDVADGNGRQPIHFACRSGYKGVVEFLIAKGVKLNVYDGEGQLPIHYASKEGNSSVVNLLMRYGAKMDAPDENGRLDTQHEFETDL